MENKVDYPKLFSTLEFLFQVCCITFH